MHKYTLGLIALVVLSLGCSKGRVEIGNISNRQQLDSIIALLPSDSVELDSLPHRTLHIRLRGDLSLHGIPIKTASFDLEKEELKGMNVEYAKTGCLSLLNTEESLHGLGRYSSDSFKWFADQKDITLQPIYSDRWTYEKPEPLHLSDTLGFIYTVSFVGNVKNKITELYKEKEQSKDFNIYSLRSSFYSSINYKMYLNDFLINDFSDDVNELLPLPGKQVITIEFLPPFDKIREVNEYAKRLASGGQQYVHIYKESEKGAKPTLIEQLVINTDVDKSGAVQHYVVDIPNITYRLSYAEGVNLREVDDLKSLIYSYYASFKSTIEAGDSNKFIEMIYPMERNEFLAYNEGMVELQHRWANLELMIDENEGVDLMDLTDLEIEYAAAGRLARLVPKRGKEDDVSAARVYMIGGSPRNIAYYVSMDKNNKLNFALR